MKTFFRFALLFLFVLLITACSEKEGQLTMVDVKKLNDKGVYEDVALIFEEEKLETVLNSFAEVKWSPNTKAQMASEAEYLVTLFYTEDKNMPERLYDYKVWLNKNGSVTLISSEESEGYGSLDQEHAESLKPFLQ
ncbi:hypothetical protein A8F94_00390 [Bacillus sp. FJAT-27225]|uniref:hypothetical protein n=1 Tax=Bacillus sp. FJAT-27225 TaxID=1743144 RepID=UPI00080C3096|nr:hypothetical protein [Bacillus sp. FJAT-27225]OCA90391.1 hypothetical protein A8F94_00390 [Bacillus sp. FJAT-27225]